MPCLSVGCVFGDEESEFCSLGDLEFGAGPVEVSIDRAHGHGEGVGNLFVGQTRRDEGCDFAFTAGQRRPMPSPIITYSPPEPPSAVAVEDVWRLTSDEVAFRLTADDQSYLNYLKAHGQCTTSTTVQSLSMSTRDRSTPAFASSCGKREIVKTVDWVFSGDLLGFG